MSAMAVTLDEVMVMGDQGTETLDDLRKKVIAGRFKDELNWQDLTQGDVATRSNEARKRMEARVNLKELSDVKAWSVSDVLNERSISMTTMWKVADGLGMKLSTIIARAEEEMERRLKELEEAT